MNIFLSILLAALTFLGGRAYEQMKVDEYKVKLRSKVKVMLEEQDRILELIKEKC